MIGRRVAALSVALWSALSGPALSASEHTEAAALAGTYWLSDWVRLDPPRQLFFDVTGTYRAAAGIAAYSCNETAVRYVFACERRPTVAEAEFGHPTMPTAFELVVDPPVSVFVDMGRPYNPLSDEQRHGASAFTAVLFDGIRMACATRDVGFEEEWDYSSTSQGACVAAGATPSLAG